MTELARRGKMFTIRVFASILLISIYVIVSYNIVIDNVETKKIIQQIIRFALTITLMYFVFRGKKLAVQIFTVLFSVAIIQGLFTLFGATPFIGKIPILIMTIIYSLAIYHLNFSKSFKEYFDYLSSKY